MKIIHFFNGDNYPKKIPGWEKHFVTDKYAYFDDLIKYGDSIPKKKHQDFVFDPCTCDKVYNFEKHVDGIIFYYYYYY